MGYMRSIIIYPKPYSIYLRGTIPAQQIRSGHNPTFQVAESCGFWVFQQQNPNKEHQAIVDTRVPKWNQQRLSDEGRPKQAYWGLGFRDSKLKAWLEFPAA